tara:strand:- start:5 stop:388 length:384 start_codon:yes stop_codon:yes gene_type:complete
MLNPMKNIEKPEASNQSVSVISDEITIVGNINSTGDLVINGKVDGEINCDSLEIGPNGDVKGSIKAEFCLVSGNIEGKLSAKSINVSSTGNLNGRISYGKLEIENGANVEIKLRKTKQLSNDNETYE